MRQLRLNIQSRTWFLALKSCIGAKVLVLVFIAFGAVMEGGCSTSTKPPSSASISAEKAGAEQVRPKKIEKGIESQLKLKKDKEVTAYLEKIAKTLLDGTPELQNAPVKVSLILDKDRKWRNYALPQNRIYLSVSLLKKFEYENEVAAMIAKELSHLMRKHAAVKKETELAGVAITHVSLKMLQKETSRAFSAPVYSNPRENFDFSEQKEIEAIQTSVGILYRAGYDARGLISLCEKFQNNPKHSPYRTKALLDEMRDEARKEISLFAPLRNPIVQSQNFLLIKKRIQLL
jgi:predicted Zn-dependent protease